MDYKKTEQRWKRLQEIITPFFFLMVFFFAQGALADPQTAPTSPTELAGGILGETNNQDLAPRLLEHLFMGVPLPEFRMQQQIFQNTFQLLLGFLSTGILFFAAIIMFYFLLSMLMESAHTGEPFGKRTNTSWAPIRVVLALLLLVPFNFNLRQNTDPAQQSNIVLHMNAGQYAVYHVALLGSNLASKAWQQIVPEILGNMPCGVAYGSESAAPAWRQNNCIPPRADVVVEESARNMVLLGYCHRTAQIFSRAQQWSNRISLVRHRDRGLYENYDTVTNTAIGVLNYAGERAEGAENSFREAFRGTPTSFLDGVGRGGNILWGIAERLVAGGATITGALVGLPGAAVRAVDERLVGKWIFEGSELEHGFSFGNLDFPAGKIFFFGVASPQETFDRRIGEIYNLCGSIEMRTVHQLSNLGEDIADAGTHSGETRRDLLNNLARSHKDTLKEFLPKFYNYGGLLADQKLSHMPESNNGVANQSALKTYADFSRTVQQYMIELNQNVLRETGRYYAQEAERSTDNIERIGWISSALFFNNITRLQGTRFTLIGSLPQVKVNRDEPANPLSGDFWPNLRQGYKNIDELFVYGESTGSQAAIREQAVSGGVSIRTVSTGDARQIVLERPNMDIISALGSIAGIACKDAQIYTDLDGNNIPDSSWSWLIPRLNPQNMVFSLTDLGHKKIHCAWGMIKAGMLAMTVKAGTDLVAMVGSYLGPIGRVIGALVGGIGGSLAQALSTIMFLFGFAGLIGGILLAHVLPLMFFFRVTVGILTWLAAIFEAMIAVPLYALGNLNPEGEGLAIQSTRKAYIYILQIFLRPMMIIIGLVIALLLINSMGGFLNLTFNFAIDNSQPLYGRAVIFDLIWLIIYVVLAYSIVNLAVKIIDILPEQAVSWIGEKGIDYGFDDKSIVNNATKAASGIIAADKITDLSSAAAETGQSVEALGKAKDSWRKFPKGTP